MKHQYLYEYRLYNTKTDILLPTVYKTYEDAEKDICDFYVVVQLGVRESPKETTLKGLIKLFNSVDPNSLEYEELAELIQYIEENWNE